MEHPPGGMSDASGALLLDDVLETLDRSALAAVLCLDDVAAGADPDGADTASRRFYALLARETEGLDPTAMITTAAADRLMVGAAALLVAESMRLTEWLQSAPGVSETLAIRAEGVIDRATTAARSLLDVVEHRTGSARSERPLAAASDDTADGTETASPRHVSGLLGAERIADDVLTRQLIPPTDHLPVLRGRTELVEELVDQLDDPDDRLHVLVGGAGAGKSTIALEVAHRARERDVPTWWVCGRDQNQLIRGLLAVATFQQTPVDEFVEIQQWPPEDGLDRLWRRLDGSARPWLLVLDDVDDPGTLGLDSEARRPWVRPSAAGTVLITSRVDRPAVWGTDARIRPVADLGPGAGAELLLDRMGLRGGDRTTAVGAARTVSDQLGGVPLALGVVGSYLGSDVARHTIDGLSAALPRHGDTDVHGRVRSAVRLGLDALVADGRPQARSLLAVLAHYAPERTIADNVLDGEELTACGLVSGSDAASWEAALDGLLAAGLASRRVTVGQRVHGVTVHSLVAEVALEEFGDTADRDLLEATAVHLLRRAAERCDPGRPADWPALHRLEPHVYRLIDRMRTQDWRTRADVLGLADRVAQGLVRAGLFMLAEKLIRHAQSRTALLLRPDDQTHLAAEHTLAWALGLRGRAAEAEERFRLLLDLRQASSGYTDPGTLAVRDSLAWMLAERGQLREAHRLLCALLPDRQRILGSRDPATMATRHRLGWIQALLGNLEAAEITLRSVLDERQAVLGPHHMDVLGTRYRLAWVLGHRGHPADAEGLFRDIVTDLTAMLAADHPTTLLARSRVAWSLTLQGRLSDAADGYGEVLEARERVLGPDHPRTMAARQDLAYVLTHRGHHAAAEALLRKVLRDRTRLFGRTHLRTITTRIRLAELVAEQGDLVSADRRLRRLATNYRRSGRTEHPQALFVRYLSATVHRRAGLLDQAEQELVTLLGDQQRIYGLWHRTTLDTRERLAEVLGARGMLDEAALQLSQILVDRRRMLGDRIDVTVLTTREQLGRVLVRQGRTDEAQRLYETLLMDRQALLEPTHPHVLATRYRLAWLAHRTRRTERAVHAYRALLTDQTEALGPRHPDTLRTRGGLARALLGTGASDQAGSITDALLTDQRAVLGDQHPGTLHTVVTRALVDAATGRPDQAVETLNELITTQEVLLGEHHPFCATVREHLGWVLAGNDRADEARDVWTKLEHDRQTVLGSGHPDVVRLRTWLAAGPPGGDRS